MAVSNTFVYLAVMSTLVRIVGYALCIASLPYLEKRAGIWPSGLAAIKKAAIPVTALILCVVLMTFASMKAWLTLLIFSIVGSAFYWFARNSK
jgi:amino acid transporter